jgi:hypothetical protein
VRRLILLCLAAGCSSAEPLGLGRFGSAGSPSSPPPDDSLVAAAAAAAAEVPPPPAFPPEVRSLRLRRSTVVKLLPDAASKNLGTVAADTRVGYGRAAQGPGCSGRWIAIEPRGWVCEAYLEPREELPAGVELPRLGRGQRMPGLYGKVTAKGARIVTMVGGAVKGQRAAPDSTMVRREGEAIIGGVPHWRIGKDEYLAARSIKELPPPEWHGVRLGDDTGLAPPLAFAVSEKHVLDRVTVWAEPEARRKVRTLAPRVVVPVLDRGEGGALRIGDGEWLRAADARLVEATAPPAGLAPDERWIDVDLDQQLVVAYDGDQPAYATLMSGGKKKTPTETGLFRVWIKFAETTMSGNMADEPSYSVATVPWTQFYAKDFALHTAYWHDRFGLPRSHGCVNLSPTDARFLYFWSQPDVPPGWSMAHGVVERPGSLIRVRSAADPEPVAKGYAATVAARLASSDGSVTTTP